MPDISGSAFNEKLEILKQNKPAVDDTAKAGFSFGFARAKLTDSDMLRNLISKADVKMYESKREKNRVTATEQGIPAPQMRPAEYTVEE